MITLSEALSNFSGTTNYVAKYTPTGNVLGISQIFDNGTNVGIGTASPTSKLQIVGTDSTSSNYSLKIDNSASSPLFYVRNDGNVGIGIASPLTKLQVVGGSIQGIYSTSTNDIAINGVGSGSSSYGVKGETDLGYALFAKITNGSGTSGIAIRAHDQNGNTIFTVNGNGNVGINTITPSEKLEVNGNIKTAQPSANGAGSWKLGKKVTATVSLVTTDYIEVEIDSVVYKLALVS